MADKYKTLPIGTIFTYNGNKYKVCEDTCLNYICSIYALKEGKRKYDEIINFITDELLKPFGYKHNSRIYYKNKTYKIHRANLSDDGEITVVLTEIAYDFYDIDRIKVPITEIM